MLGNVISIYASDFLGTLLGIPPAEAVNQLTIIRSLQGTGAIFMFLSAVLMGPIIEELIFRKSIFGVIKNDKIA
jgi:membrane protease YdiL (CAAX protease family)